MIRLVRRVCALCAILQVAVLVAACGTSPTSPSTTAVAVSSTSTTTTSSTVSVTETVRGTLTSGGTNYHVFHTMPGVFTVTVASTDQPSNPGLGMSFGMWDGQTCTGVLYTLSAVPTTVLTGTAALETDVCIRMWDPVPWDAGFTLNYNLSVVHFAKSS
jgi:hypothetical protein